MDVHDLESGLAGPVLRAEAILNPPQVALLGIPGLLYAPLAIETDARAACRRSPADLRPSLTFDHRALDGGHVIRFLNDLKRTLEAALTSRPAHAISAVILELRPAVQVQ